MHNAASVSRIYRNLRPIAARLIPLIKILTGREAVKNKTTSGRAFIRGGRSHWRIFPSPDFHNSLPNASFSYAVRYTNGLHLYTSFQLRLCQISCPNDSLQFVLHSIFHSIFHIFAMVYHNRDIIPILILFRKIVQSNW